MTYNALRTGRVSLIGQVYLVTTVTAGRERIFGDLQLARGAVRALRASDRAGDTHTLAFVVMPDHVHWLLELTSKTTLDRIMKRFKGSTAHPIDAARARRGSVWQPSFHDHALRTDESLANVARYVIMNPVRARLVESIEYYPHWDVVWDVAVLDLSMQAGSRPHGVWSEKIPTYRDVGNTEARRWSVDSPNREHVRRSP